MGYTINLKKTRIKKKGSLSLSPLSSFPSFPPILILYSTCLPMLPNSRIIPPNNNHNNTNKNVRARSNSAINDSSVRKGFMSRLLTSPVGSNSSPKEYNTSSVSSRPKYESVLGIQTKDDYATWGTPRIIPSDQKVSRQSPHLSLQNHLYSPCLRAGCEAIQ